MNSLTKLSSCFLSLLPVCRRCTLLLLMWLFCPAFPFQLLAGAGAALQVRLSDCNGSNLKSVLPYQDVNVQIHVADKRLVRLLEEMDRQGDLRDKVALLINGRRVSLGKLPSAFVCWTYSEGKTWYEIDLRQNWNELLKHVCLKKGSFRLEVEMGRMKSDTLLVQCRIPQEERRAWQEFEDLELDRFFEGSFSVRGGPSVEGYVFQVERSNYEDVRKFWMDHPGSFLSRFLVDRTKNTLYHVNDLGGKTKAHSGDREEILKLEEYIQRNRLKGHCNWKFK